MFKLKKKQEKEVKRITEYMISGGAYFWVGYGMFFVMDKGLGLSLWWAKLLANISGWTVNYLLQRYWVFNNPKLKSHQTEVTFRYIAITLIDFGLEFYLVQILGISGEIRSSTSCQSYYCAHNCSQGSWARGVSHSEIDKYER